MSNQELIQEHINYIIDGEEVYNVVDSLTERFNLASKILGGVTAGFSLVAIYDLIMSRGQKKNADELTKIMKEGKLVNSKEFVKKVDKTIEVLTNTQEIRRGLRKEKKLTADEIESFARYIGDILAKGSNAFAFPGNEAMYVFLSPRCHADVIAHEIGHIIDFRKRKVTFSNMKRKGFFHVIFKNKYMRDERVAWDEAPGKGTKDRSKLRELALKSYEKFFHIRRSNFNGAMAGLSLMAFLSVFFNHDLSKNR